MRFLLDECLSPQVARLLVEAGHDAAHAAEFDLLGHTDEEVMSVARSDRRVLLSADTDFGELLARSGDLLPSVILLRRQSHSATDQVGVVLAALIDVSSDVEAGAIVVVEDNRIRVRRLPIHPA